MRSSEAPRICFALRLRLGLVEQKLSCRQFHSAIITHSYSPYLTFLNEGRQELRGVQTDMETNSNISVFHQMKITAVTSAYFGKVLILSRSFAHH